jgi:glycogen phosphorylase
MAILNSVRMGGFSSDRSIAEYCNDIWKVTPFPVGLVDYGDIGGESSGRLTCKLS